MRQSTVQAEGRTIESTKYAILDHLLGGERHVLALGKDFGIRESAMRRHCMQLEERGLITGSLRQMGLGRPKRLYAITEAGRAVYPSVPANAASLAIGNIADLVHPQTKVFDAVKDFKRSKAVLYRQAVTPLSQGRAVSRALEVVGIHSMPKVANWDTQIEVLSRRVLETVIGSEFAETFDLERLTRLIKVASGDEWSVKLGRVHTDA